MPIVINTNVPALKAQNSLTRATWGLNTSLERLTTGKRINHAGDDPAGYYYASSLNTQIRGINVAYQNVANAANMLSIGEGDLGSINTQLERIKDLATQFSNTSITQEEKDAIIAEAKSRVEEIDRLSKDSKFNKINLLDGSLDGGVRIQVGAGADASTNAITISDVFEKADSASIKLVGGSSKYASIDAAFADATTSEDFEKEVQKAIDLVTKRISNAGIYTSRLTSISESLLTQNENLTSAYSTVMDADVAAETASYIKYQLLQQTASAMLTQANQAQGVLALKLVNTLT